MFPIELLTFTIRTFFHVFLIVLTIYCVLGILCYTRYIKSFVCELAVIDAVLLKNNTKCCR